MSDEAELIDAAASLLESLDLPHKSRVIDPLVRKLTRTVRRNFLRTVRGSEFGILYTKYTKAAFKAGAKQAAQDLGPLKAIREAKKRRPVIPVLPDPKRTAELAEQQIDWADLDHSPERAAMIAEFEVSSAYHDGMQAFAGLWRGGNGPIEKAWKAQADACDTICQPNDSMGFIDEEAPFDSGDFSPPGHPNCRCSMEYRAVQE